MKKYLIIFIHILLLTNIAIAQKLKPGFSKNEYLELLKINSKHTNPEFFKDIPNPNNFVLAHRSPVVGLENAWELWTSTENTAAISIRGTTASKVSWLANFYSAMVSAKGELVLAKGDTFKYELAQNPNASVHVGWLVSTAFLVKGIVPAIDSCYKAGIKDIYIVGHSQGGGISFLLTAYLYNLQKRHLLPADIRFKTYCSAGPKPGNLEFAYEYEAMTQEGWAYNVVNTSDWVPEVPLTVQTINDFPYLNPFKSAKKALRKLKFPKDLALIHVYNRLDKPSRRAQRNYGKYLGKMLSKQVRKNIKDFQQPKYAKSNNYVRTGNTIVLLGDEEYFKRYPNDKTKIFTHHFPDAYLYLAKKLK
jgi:hypothetical protein